MRIATLTLLLIVGTTSTLIGIGQTHKTVWHWEDDFSKSEKEMLTKWLTEVVEGTQRTLGRFQFDVHLHLHRRDNSSEPVPWANTWKWPYQSAHFHVDPSYPYEDFMADWTAPHEISHLALPYIGENNSWFAEGFASYMQYQIMMNMGILSKDEVKKRYNQKITKQRRYFQSDNDMVSICRDLKKSHRYGPMYWGGACYFIQLDQELHKSSTSLFEVVDKYQYKSRFEDRSMEDVVSSFDRLSGTSDASKMLEKFREKPARSVFP